MALSANEEKIPVSKESELQNQLQMKEYIEKLNIASNVLPDPFTLKQGWLSEHKGMGLKHWPTVYFNDIDRFLSKNNASSDLINRLQSEYKEGKAYKYFKCEWVKEIYYHEISQFSKICFIKSRVTSSQRTNSTAYYVWVAIEKDSDKPGGHVYSAYCTCTAGMLGCCIHVIGLLFRVEAAVRTGATKLSSTSVLAKWNVPTGCKTKLIHKPIAEMTFNSFHYEKKK